MYTLTRTPEATDIIQETGLDAFERQVHINESFVENATDATEELLCDMEPHSLAEIRLQIFHRGIHRSAVNGITNLVIDRLETEGRIYQTACGAYPVFCAIESDEAMYAEEFCSKYCGDNDGLWY